jgi:hypothetical protein
VHVGGGTPDVDDDGVSHGLGEQFCRSKHGSRRGEDVVRGELGQTAHPRCGGDVVVEDVLDDGAYRVDAQHINLGKDVAHTGEWFASFGEHRLDSTSGLCVARVDHRNSQMG